MVFCCKLVLQKKFHIDLTPPEKHVKQRHIMWQKHSTGHLHKNLYNVLHNTYERLLLWDGKSNFTTPYRCNHKNITAYAIALCVKHTFKQ